MIINKNEAFCVVGVHAKRHYDYLLITHEIDTRFNVFREIRNNIFKGILILECITFVGTRGNDINELKI